MRVFRRWCAANEVPPLTVGVAAINRFLSDERTRGMSVATIRRRYTALTGFFDFLVDEGLLARSPMDDRRIAQMPPRKHGASAEFLSLEELRTLIVGAAERGPDSETAICLMGIHGLQANEVESARVEHLGMRHGMRVLNLPGRSVGDWTPIVPPTENGIDRILERRSSTGPLLESTEGTAMNYWALRRRVEWAASAAGIDPVPSLHALRNTAGALAFSRALPIDQVQDMLGNRHLRNLERLLVPVRQYRFNHAVEAVAQIVRGRSHLDEADRLLMDGDVHPAVPTMVATAAMENALREWAREHPDVNVSDERKAKMSTYGDLLRAAGALENTDVQTINRIMNARSDAAHGWFELVTPGRAEQTMKDIRDVLERHGRPMP